MQIDAAVRAGEEGGSEEEEEAAAQKKRNMFQGDILHKASGFLEPVVAGPSLKTPLSPFTDTVIKRINFSN